MTDHGMVANTVVENMHPKYWHNIGRALFLLNGIFPNGFELVVSQPSLTHDTKEIQVSVPNSRAPVFLSFRSSQASENLLDEGSCAYHIQRIIEGLANYPEVGQQ